MNESKKESLFDFLERIANGDEQAIKEWEEIMSNISETKTYEDE